MHWTLDEVRELTIEDFDELTAWAQKRAEKQDPDSMDMDEVIAAKTAKAQLEDTDG